MTDDHVWQATHYDNKLGFVSELGHDALSLLQPRSHEHILDLGCGTGDLTNAIARSGASVLGMDMSVDMLEAARAKYAHIPFIVGNGEDFRDLAAFDAVFSNAALHWMKRADDVAANVWNALKHGGRLIAEFGGQGNIACVTEALDSVLAEDYGIDATALHPWYFPSIGQYSALLERAGFRVTYAVHFDRPTTMPGGEAGLRHWLDGFAGRFFLDLTDEEKQTAYARIEARTRPALFDGSQWHIDYSRLRIAAFKPNASHE